MWHREQRPFGTGLSSSEIADLESNSIHLHQPARMSKRSVQRAVAFSLVWAADLEEGWSLSKDWKTQNGWRTATFGGDAAKNLEEAGFADERGRTSARSDLASFAAHYFFPEPGDDVRCRLLSQSRFLADRLHLPELECVAFEEWARLSELIEIEIGLAAPTRSASSMFGHLLLRVRYADGTSRLIGFVADVRGELEDDPLYAVKGLFGGYRARLLERGFEEVVRDYIVVEGRDLRRWRLNLERAEISALMVRIWTLQRSAGFGYYFLTQNCASLLIDLINAVLPEERGIHHDGAIGKGPGAALDGLTFARAAKGGPLLTYLPRPWRSLARQARDAEEPRVELRRRLIERSPDTTAAFSAIDNEDARVRADGYRRLASLAGAAPEIDGYLEASIAVESHLSAERNREREEEALEVRAKEREAMLAALEESLPRDLAFATPDPGLAFWLTRAIELLRSADDRERSDGYRAIDELLDALELAESTGADRELRRRLRMVQDGARLLALVSARQFGDPTPQRAPSYLGSAQQLVDDAYVTDVSPPLLAIAEARASLRSTAHDDHEDRDEIAAAKEMLDYQRAYSHTGVDVFGLRMSNRGLLLAAAVYDAALGDRRKHGLPPDTSITLGASDVVWGWPDGSPRVMESQTRLFGYRALRSASAGASILSRIGLEAAIDLDTMRADTRWMRGEIRGGVLVPLFASDSLSNHVLARLGASALGWSIRDRADTGGLGVPAGVELRFELGPAILKLDASASPVLNPAAPSVYVMAGSAARLRIPIEDRLALPWRGFVGLSFEASARATYSDVPHAGGLFVSADVGLRIE